VGYLEINMSNAFHNFFNDKNEIRPTNATLKTFGNLDNFCKIVKKENEDKHLLVFHTIPPSFTCLIKTSHPKHLKETISILNQFKKEDSRILSRLFENVPLSGLNHLLFRCD
jgi:hypothetical protein